MNLSSRVRRTVSAAVAFAILAVAVPAFAADENITESHLKAARAAVTAIKATDDFDGILPQAAAALKQELIQKNPDLQEIIIKTVDEETFTLAPRRGDLEKEAALSYARVFSEADLNAIAAFYSSDTGKKLISDGPIVTRELLKAADIWQRGIARDLAQSVGTKLAAVVKSQAPDPTLPAPGTEPTAPVTDGAADPAAPAEPEVAPAQ
jgi:hypothetical protein